MSNRTADTIRAAVADYLDTKGIAYTVHHLGERERDGWKHDAWTVAFARDRALASFDYSTGIGHRKYVKGNYLENIGAFRPSKPEHYYDRRPPAAIAGKPGTLFAAEWDKRHLRAVAPHAADVLHCLALDASAGTMTFTEWCADFGYDTDSRKALATYEQCQETADKMRRVFGPDAARELQQLTEGL